MSGPIEEVSEFSYLGSVVSKTGGTEEGAKLKLGRARAAFTARLWTVWTSNVNSSRMKLRLFNSNVKQLCCVVQKRGIYNGTDQQKSKCL